MVLNKYFKNYLDAAGQAKTYPQTSSSSLSGLKTWCYFYHRWMNAMIPALESLHHWLYGIHAVADSQTPAVEHNSLGIFQPHTWSSLTLFSNICSQVFRALGHWISSQTAIPYKDAPPPYNKDWPQGIPFPTMCTIRTMF